ncbi:MAG: hypothetical protein QOK43_227 [Acidimicrobiaceae bacterium]|nr:hypothetical protein [Acidimicrobiaceae bacterium]
MAPKEPDAVMVTSGQAKHDRGEWRFYAYTKGGQPCDAEVEVADGPDDSAHGGGGGSCHRRPPVDAGGGKISNDEWLYGGQASLETAKVVATLTNGTKLTVDVFRYDQFPCVYFVVQPDPDLMVSDVAAYAADGRLLGHNAVPVLPSA